MKRIINGKTYNTETARYLGGWYTGGIGSGDFRYCEEDLYITKKGQYFVAGSGGALTSYAVSCGNNSTTGSSNIELLTESEARAWAERHLDHDEYVEAFGEPEEG